MGRLRIGLMLGAVVLASGMGCAGKKGSQARGATSALAELSEEQLFQQGKELVANGKLENGRAHLRRYEQRFPRGGHIEEAKLLIADSFFADNAPEQRVEGVALYRQFLTFYPQHALACTAQYRIAEYHFRQMHSCERDQSEARSAVDEFQKLLETFPNCPEAAKARENLAVAYGRLACAEIRVAEFYRRTGEPAAAEHRLEDLLRAYPRFADRCYAQEFLIELLDKRGDLDRGRTILAQMEEGGCAGKEMERARKRVGGAPAVNQRAGDGNQQR